MFYIYTHTTNTISGSIEDTTLSIISGFVKQIFVKSATSTTTFDFQLLDDASNIVLNRTASTGTLNELLELPIHGIYTVKILNSTVDENFVIKLVIQEI